MYIVFIFLFMGVVFWCLYLWATATKPAGSQKVSRQEENTVATGHTQVSRVDYKNADFINKNCTRLDDFIINNQLTGFDLHKLAELNGIQLEIATGWYPLVIEMINELNAHGWDKRVSCIKEKYAGLRFHSHSVYNAAGEDIIEKYEKKSEHTCETCGKEGKVRLNTGWDYVACREHYLESRSRIEVMEGGFIFNGKPFNWGDVKDITFEGLNANRYKTVVVEFYTAIINHGSWLHNKINLTKNTIGFGNFLKHINSQYRRLASSYTEHFTEVDFCEICGYQAVYSGECECCENETFEKYEQGWMPDGETREGYIKDEQLQWAEDDGELYEQQNKTYPKNPAHKLLYTQQELEAYKSGTYWDD